MFQEASPLRLKVGNSCRAQKQAITPIAVAAIVALEDHLSSSFRVVRKLLVEFSVRNEAANIKPAHTLMPTVNACSCRKSSIGTCTTSVVTTEIRIDTKPMTGRRSFLDLWININPANEITRATQPSQSPIGNLAS